MSFFAAKSLATYVFFSALLIMFLLARSKSLVEYKFTHPLAYKNLQVGVLTFNEKIGIWC